MDESSSPGKLCHKVGTVGYSMCSAFWGQRQIALGGGSRIHVEHFFSILDPRYKPLHLKTTFCWDRLERVHFTKTTRTRGGVPPKKEKERRVNVHAVPFFGMKEKISCFMKSSKALATFKCASLLTLLTTSTLHHVKECTQILGSVFELFMKREIYLVIDFF